jgi:hypothetical protein
LVEALEFEPADGRCLDELLDRGEESLAGQDLGSCCVGAEPGCEVGDRSDASDLHLTMKQIQRRPTSRPA